MRACKISMTELAELLQLQLSDRGTAVLPVTGSSMLPMLRGGRDTVYLAQPQRLPKRGDVILYRRDNGQYILHRIVKEAGGALICCGDNQYTPETVLSRQVIAVVTAFERSGRHTKTTAAAYRAYTWLWVNMFPARRIYIFLRRRLAALRRRLHN